MKKLTCFSVANAALAGFYVWFSVEYLMSADGVFDATGHAIGRDFINQWTAGTLATTGSGLEIFDVETCRPMQAELLGREIPPHNWSYPPHMLLVAVPFAQLPYLWALALWTALGLGAYLLATRRLTLLIAPATFVNIFNYDLTLLGAGVLALRELGRCTGYRVAERGVWLLVWTLPLLVMALNAFALPFGCLILAAALGLAVVRLAERDASEAEPALRGRA